MNSNETDITEVPNWRPKALVIGAILGALIGAGAAYLFVQQAEEQGRTPQITPGDGVKLGVLLMGVMRSIATLGEGK